MRQPRRKLSQVNLGQEMYNVAFTFIIGIIGYIVWAGYNLHDIAFTNIVIAGVLLINIILAFMVNSLLKLNNITKTASYLVTAATVICLIVFVASVYEPEQVASNDVQEVIHE